jgi:hypothetical protein
MFVTTYCENIYLKFENEHETNEDFEDEDFEDEEDYKDEEIIKKINCECVGLYYNDKETIFWTMVYLFTKNRILNNIENYVNHLVKGIERRLVFDNFDTSDTNNLNIFVKIAKNIFDWHMKKYQTTEKQSFGQDRDNIIIEISTIISENISTVKELLNYIESYQDGKYKTEWNIDIKEI